MKTLEGRLKVGDRIYSKFFKRWIVITRINSNNNWYFVIEGGDQEFRAQTPLSYFEEEIA